MDNNWVKSGNKYFLQEVSQQYKEIPKGIYKLEFDEMSRQFYLSRTGDSFNFDYKIYGNENKFINWTLKSYENTKGNFGLLLNGVKGTGKSVTAKLLSNKLNLPVIIVHTAYEGLSNYLNNIQQDCVLFFDEYEKMYDDYEHSILTVMDGVLDSGGYRKVFLLTTNKKYVNENMLQRPSRIRYVKTFKDLSIEIITEIVDDLLKNKSLRQDTIDFISKLEIITTDIVKSLIEEVNIHDVSPEEFKDIFNIQVANKKVDIFYVNEKGENVTVRTNVSVNYNDMEDMQSGKTLYASNNDYLGRINSIVSEDLFIVDDFRGVDYDKPLNGVKVGIVRNISIHSSFTHYVL